MCKFVDVKQEYLLGEEIERCCGFNGIQLLHFKDKDKSRGIIFLNNISYIQDKSPLTYIDIIYEAQGSIKDFITFENTDFKITTSVLYGGIRIFSLPISSIAIIKNRVIKFNSKAHLDFKDIIIRQDYYDFLGLKSGALYNIASKKNEEKAIELFKDRELAIQWFVTWKCNYKCEYCWQERQPNIYRRISESDNEISPEMWAKKINQLKPRSIYITGGEPTLYKELPRLISMLDNRIELLMTSNFSRAFNVEVFSKYVSPDRFSSLAFSLHPLQCDMDLFFEKLSHLVRKKYNNLLVVMVLYLKNLPYAELVLRKCAELGVQVKFDPCVLEGEDRLYYASKRYNQLAKYYIEKANTKMQQVIMDYICKHLYTKKYMLNFSRFMFNLRDKIPFLNKYKSERPDAKINVENVRAEKIGNGRIPIYCSAGSKRITIDNEGNVYVCMSAMHRSKLLDRFSLPHYLSIGNIFSKDFNLLEKPIICWESFRCSACDFEYLSYAWTEMANDIKNITLPLPE